MAGVGRISLLVSRDLQTLVQVARGLDREVAAQLRKHTRKAAEPIFQDAVRANVTTRLQTRVLSDTARVSVSDSNVTLKSAMVGKVHGIPTSVLAPATEFGAQPTTLISTTSKTGTPYKRRIGSSFGLPRRKGYVFHPAVRESIPRMASLWLQTALRTVAEQFEKGER
ncbi:hypothetical protein [Diaminobutyricimonas sp. LJ205]|uniref:hypothetical protein n=1 Tax=Diaminobutyricimonas sp. LJ205 TaxID=2683590 RepID=UPI0012F48377|nr:hypothetical protein [Diaminobutyricimonas sp. LJ205]